MLSIDPYFTPSVGVAPGTTTMALAGLGCAGCPPDEPWMYTSPPVVDTAPGDQGSGTGADIQVTQTSATAPMAMTVQPAPVATMPPGTRHVQPWNVYATESRLRGLSGIWDTGAPRWGLVLFGGLFVFAAVLGIGYWHRAR